MGKSREFNYMLAFLAPTLLTCSSSLCAPGEVFIPSLVSVPIIICNYFTLKLVSIINVMPAH